MARTLVDWQRPAVAAAEAEERMPREFCAGAVWARDFAQADISAPFGGFRQSVFGGNCTSFWAIDEFVNLKAAWISLGRGGR
jgi:acyl-CoA reductase-like NAD-dependent aldehyde dehydrogenase